MKIERFNSQDNLAFGQQDKIPISQIYSGSEGLRTRKLVSWYAHSALQPGSTQKNCPPELIELAPQNFTFLLSSNAQEIPGEGEIAILAKLTWTVQTIEMTALIDFVSGTKFQLVADSFSIESFLEAATPVSGGEIIIGALWSQNALANVNGLAPQRTIYRNAFNYSPFERFLIPKFARNMRVLRFPSTAAYTIEFSNNDILTTIAQIEVGANGDQLIPIPISNYAARIRIAQPVGADPITHLNLIFDIDL